MNLARNGSQIIGVPMETQLVLGDSLGGGLGGREGGSGHTYARGGLMLVCGRNQHNTVRQSTFS